MVDLCNIHLVETYFSYIGNKLLVFLDIILIKYFFFMKNLTFLDYASYPLNHVTGQFCNMIMCDSS